MNYFLSIDNDALAPELLAHLRKAVSEEDMKQGGHPCFAGFLRSLPNLVPWFHENLRLAVGCK